MKQSKNTLGILTLSAIVLVIVAGLFYGFIPAVIVLAASVAGFFAGIYSTAAGIIEGKVPGVTVTKD